MANHTFVTGQFVRIGQKLANASDRVWAALIDLLVMYGGFTMIMSIIGMLVASDTYSESYFNSGPDYTNTMIVIVLVVLGPLVLFYPLWMERFFSGRTVGKMALGLRVVGSDGSTPSFSSSFFRWLFSLVEVFTGFGLVVILFTKDNQRFGDIAGDTYVVKVRKPYYGRSLSLNDFPPDYKPVFPQVVRLSQAQVNLIYKVYYLRDRYSEQLRLDLCNRICRFLEINVSGMTPYQFLGQINYDFKYYTAVS